MREFSPGLFVAQLFLIPLFCFIAGGMAADLAIDITGLSISGYVMSALVGMAIGYVAQRSDERTADSFGQWIWIPPVLIGLWAITHDIRLGFSAVCYFETCNGPDLPGIQMFLVTFTAISSCFYAAGISLARRIQKKQSKIV